MEKFIDTIINGEYVYACSIELNEGKVSLNRNLKPTKLLVVEKEYRSGEKYFTFQNEKGKEVNAWGTKKFSKIFYMFDNLEEAKEKYKEISEKIKKELERNVNDFIRIKEDTLKKINSI